jgi:hypothetical protein
VLPQLLDGGSVAAILVALERTAVYGIRALRSGGPVRKYPQYHPVGNPPGSERNERLIMTSTAPENGRTPVDPYAGARAMGVTAPPLPDASGDPKPAVTGDDNADYASYIAWRNSQKPAAGLTPRAAVTVTPDAATPVGAYLGADVTAAENTVEALAPGLVSRLRTIISDHQSLIDELSQVVGEVEKM